ncbi:hypothetical protein AAF712_008207 [Marasmius tenuissimus]|uniref:UDP-Glycosyltransferase/glycogen phosphorylase n=1 Tax=Marasmius tenuissimus TaxID=585030 RepID=A0ABR2ZU19_9AGAR
MVLLAEAGDDVRVTSFTGAMHVQVMQELAKVPQERFEKVASRINVIDVASSSHSMFDAPGFAEAFNELYSGSGKITCLSSKKVFTNLPRPDIVILDPVSGKYSVEAIRKVASPKELPVWSWMTSSLGATMRVWGPKRYGGRAEELEEITRLEDPAERTARVVKILTDMDDKAVSLPGYPPAFTYELNPQEVHFPLELPASAFLIGYKYIYETEGYISVTTSILEAEVTDAWRKHMSSLGKEVYEVGFVASTIENSKEQGDPEVMNFLEKMQKKHGEKSVGYISFGSVWWPGDPEKLFAIIDELIESKSPFLIANPSFAPIHTLPENVVKKINDSGVGLATKWAPQDAILQHPATEWFLTHGGWNGTQEGVKYKVPMIFWPVLADQPLNASLLSVKLQAGFELISVRGGAGAKRPARFTEGQPDPLFTVDAARSEFKDVLNKVRGAEGAAVRNNLLRLSTEVGKLWGDEGQSRQEFDKFVKKHVFRGRNL